jgi:hypothetical protein
LANAMARHLGRRQVPNCRAAGPPQPLPPAWFLPTSLALLLLAPLHRLIDWPGSSHAACLHRSSDPWLHRRRPFRQQCVQVCGALWYSMLHQYPWLRSGSSSPQNGAHGVRPQLYALTTQETSIGLHMYNDHLRRSQTVPIGAMQAAKHTESANTSFVITGEPDA